MQNPALGLASPERVLSCLSPRVGAYNPGLFRRGVPGLGALARPGGPGSVLSALGYCYQESKELFHSAEGNRDSLCQLGR